MFYVLFGKCDVFVRFGLCSVFVVVKSNMFLFSACYTIRLVR